MMKTWIRNAIPISAILLLHAVLYSSLASFSLRPHRQARILPVVSWFIFGFAIGGIVFPHAVRFLRRSKAAGKLHGRSAGVAPLVLLLFAWIPFVFFGFDVWLQDNQLRHYTNFMIGMLVPVGFHFFFTFIQPKSKGLWLGIGLAFGNLLWRWLTEGHKSGVGLPMSELETVFLAQCASLFLFSLLCLYAALFMTPEPSCPPIDKTVPFYTELRKKDYLFLYSSMALIYIMNGIVDLRLYPGLMPTPPAFEPAQILAIMTCPIAGWLIDRHPFLAARRIILIAAAVFIISPSLVTLGDSPSIYAILHALSAFSQYILYIALTTFVVSLTKRDEWVCRLPTFVFGIRLISVFSFWLFKNELRLRPGLSELAATFLALLAFLLLLRIRFISLSGESVDGESADEAENAEPPDAASYDSSIIMETFLHSRNLTPREREVASLILQGLSTRDIATRLSISEHTVKTHVKRALEKFELPNRKSFVAACFTTTEQDPA